MAKVAVQSVQDYTPELIDQAINQLFDELGGITNYIPQHSKVFVKVNLVRDMPPEKCGTTHPEVVRAVCKRIIEQCNAEVIVGDSSGGAYTKAFMNNCFRITKMDYACTASGAQLNDNFDYAPQQLKGVRLHETDITSSFINADVVVNIGKLKTHSFTGYTGCVKNLFGLIPGLVKVEVHSKYPNINDFVDCIIDIERYAAPKIALHILDAVMGMEGDGPTNGKPRYIGKLIASPSAYAADVVGVSLFDEPHSMPIIKRAIQRGILDTNFSDVEYNLASLNSQYIDDFRRVDVIPQNFLRMPRWLQQLIKSNITRKVAINSKVCRGCGKCVRHCPATALKLNAKRKATVNQRKCIRCYCCQELCPFDAVVLHKPLVYRVVRTFSHTKNKQK